MLYKDSASTWESQHSPAEKTVGMPYNPKGRKANGVRAVGQPDSTRESGESRRREAERGQCLKSLLCKAISKRKHWPYTEVE